eukprot:TRINITY_DN11883_c0_g1_i1.p1 TRINITY_DN11883_c0_g1~~TRINITY_DN11883_c0_g1_i1.p1  ORF type:complete len:454 (+),score=84.17 TRINITY_DN11883_c0_g1_i1:24-1364(+)
MAYRDTLSKIFSRLPKKGFTDISRIERAAALLGNPHEGLRAVHVTGSNGKGTVCWKLAAALQAAGFRVGLFTGPHISTYRERIRINNEMITESAVVNLTQRVFDSIRGTEIEPLLSFFDISVLTAFLYFREANVDVAVVEVGIGGRLDPTNVLPPPLLAILTSISLEHTDYLGETVELICGEKAGIIKQGTPAVLGPTVPWPVVQHRAKETGSEVHQLAHAEGRDFEKENEEIVRLALGRLRAYPFFAPRLIPKQESDGTALRRFVAANPEVEAALKTLDRCRFEICTSDQLKKTKCPYAAPAAVVFDVGHNPGALEAFFRRVAETFPGRKLHVLMGMSFSKDLVASGRIILQHAASIHLAPCAHYRLALSSKIATELRRLQQEGSGRDVAILEYGDKQPDNVPLAVDKAFAAAGADGVVCVCGSFFIMSPIRDALNFGEPTDPAV